MRLVYFNWSVRKILQNWECCSILGSYEIRLIWPTERKIPWLKRVFPTSGVNSSTRLRLQNNEFVNTENVCVCFCVSSASTDFVLLYLGEFSFRYFEENHFFSIPIPLVFIGSIRALLSTVFVIS